MEINPGEDSQNARDNPELSFGEKAGATSSLKSPPGRIQVDDRTLGSKDSKDTEMASGVCTVEKRPCLQLEIPERLLEQSDPGIVRVNLPPTPGSNKGSRSLIRGILRRPSFKSRASNSDVQKNGLTSSASLKVFGSQGNGKVSGFMSFSWAHALRPLSARRTSSLPVTPVAAASSFGSNSQHGVLLIDGASSSKLYAKGNIVRSLSVPTWKAGSLKRLGSAGAAMILVRPATPRVPLVDATGNLKEIIPVKNGDEEERGDEILEEEAVCRICMDALNEEGDTLKMECSCKGELALAHEECVMKWFGIRGNRTCDVCGQEVKNLPVTLIRLPTESTDGSQQTQVAQSVDMHRMWQDVPVLVMISMLAYFCFLEQLLANAMGSSALAIALPFSCILGLLASITAATIVKRRFIWIYAAFQFGLVILLSHLFYSVLHVEAVMAILLGSLAAFGLGMSANALISEYIKWKSRISRQYSDARILEQDGLNGTQHASQVEPLPREDIVQHEDIVHHDIENVHPDVSSGHNDVLLRIAF
eukprot:c25547_g1_i1 orf=414-2012(+)